MLRAAGAPTLNSEAPFQDGERSHSFVPLGARAL